MIGQGSTGSVNSYAPADFPHHLRGGIAAIGNFDGVHRGHATLIRAAVEEAEVRGLPAVAMTFDPHPRTFFRPLQPVFRITPLPSRARILRALGIEGLAVASFNADFAARSAENFIDQILVDHIGIKGAVVGFNFRFGRGRRGTVDMLQRVGRKRDFSVSVVEPVGSDGEVITSSAVRQALRSGDVTTANHLLGYRWFAAGEVIAGEKRGRELGYPTANIALWPDCQLRHGIYAVTFRLADGRDLGGVASFGRRPTFDDGPPLLETHVFDFDGDLYGQAASVGFVGWIREEQKFASAEDLITAMDRDAVQARQVLATAPPPTDLDQALARLG